MAPTEISTAGEAHICKHCQVPLEVGLAQPQPPFRIPFPHSVKKATAAAQDGCPIFKELMSSYSHRSLRKLITSHLLHKCNCCKGLLQRLQYVLSSLSFQPFQLLFLEHLYDSGPEPMLDSFVYLDCGNGPIDPRYNVYTYSGKNSIWASHIISVQPMVSNAEKGQCRVTRSEPRYGSRYAIHNRSSKRVASELPLHRKVVRTEYVQANPPLAPWKKRESGSCHANRNTRNYNFKLCLLVVLLGRFSAGD